MESAAAVATPRAWFSVDVDPTGPPAVIQLVASDQHPVLEFRDGRTHTRVGQADHPDLVHAAPKRQGRTTREA